MVRNLFSDHHRIRLAITKPPIQKSALESFTRAPTRRHNTLRVNPRASLLSRAESLYPHTHVLAHSSASRPRCQLQSGSTQTDLELVFHPVQSIFDCFYSGSDQFLRFFGLLNSFLGSVSANFVSPIGNLLILAQISWFSPGFDTVSLVPTYISPSLPSFLQL